MSTRLRVFAWIVVAVAMAIWSLPELVGWPKQWAFVAQRFERDLSTTQTRHTGEFSSHINGRCQFCKPLVGGSIPSPGTEEIIGLR